MKNNAKPGKIRVLIVDGHSMARKSLTALIDHETDLSVCAQAENFRDALQQIGGQRPDIVVMNFSVSNINGMDFIREVGSFRPRPAILVISMQDGPVYAENALAAGAQGYIAKDHAAEEVVPAIRRLAKAGSAPGVKDGFKSG